MPAPFSEEKYNEWKRRVEEQRHSGLPISQWCSQRKIPKGTFYYWKEKFFPKELHRSSFSEVDIKPHRQQTVITLQTQGIHLRISEGCDPALRQQLFALFAGSAC